VYNQDRPPEVEDVEGLAAAANKHLELLDQSVSRCKEWLLSGKINNGICVFPQNLSGFKETIH
jgi:hypothetical protein